MKVPATSGRKARWVRASRRGSCLMLALAKAQLVNPRSTEEYCEIILGCKVCSASNKNNWRSLIPNSAQAHVKFANSRLLKDRRTLGSCKRINNAWMKSNSGNLNLAHPQVMLAMCCERKRWSSAGCAPKWAKAPISLRCLNPSFAQAQITLATPWALNVKSTSLLRARAAKAWRRLVSTIPSLAMDQIMFVTCWEVNCSRTSGILALATRG
mmetsp:Transcript_85687/g.149569  ORF Transcript_85687/g.149569 Transcript_85687/m.149569 type:complete len:212 (+) Transcript_85687:616-1251(+)